MSYNPRTLQDLGAYWTGQGGVNLGVVGDTGHTVGLSPGPGPYLRPTGQGDDDYSVKHPRDSAGLSGAASAIDLGRLNGELSELYAFSRWLVSTSEGRRGYPGDYLFPGRAEGATVVRDRRQDTHGSGERRRIPPDAYAYQLLPGQ